MILILMLVFFDNDNLLLINIFVAITSSISMTEIFNAMNVSNMSIISIPTLVFMILNSLLNNNLISELNLFLYTFIILSAMVFYRYLKLNDISVIYALAIIISFSLSKIVKLKNMDLEFGSFYVLISLGIAWYSDTGAYFFGKFFGKNKLCPKISPNKTVEGFIGGIITCLILVIVTSLVFNNLIFAEKHKINYTSLIILSLIGSSISTLGDLCFSVIKRNYNLKDFGDIIPGHGGMLDRLDSVIFVVPYVYIYLNFLSIIK
ncbi:MAG: phosphatidate cytidylyltransferase [Candidatus Paraimprobicoccus trichonymphae]|uniref:Phosphatidate cytidylyltransferase n=1 Tax=Candidatus Paraimprobicoccus trichonymphae TaxID=3033793 RepID=A0AA48I4C8_9FIRM|nr:MAG: phosphatidate cytidylyltransferase [Candidatus Paraimprobicoccus trichonymphae]